MLKKLITWWKNYKLKYIENNKLTDEFNKLNYSTKREMYLFYNNKSKFNFFDLMDKWDKFYSWFFYLDLKEKKYLISKFGGSKQ